MSLIVEDGTGKSDAESYVSVADFKTYADARGLSYGSATDTEIEQALRRSTQWLDATYGGYFLNGANYKVGKGLMYLPGVYRVQPDQALIFPLSGLLDRAGYIVAADAVPRQIVQATCEAAVREIASAGSLSPDVTPGKVKRRVQVGPISTEYAVGTGGARSQVPVLSIVDGILSTLLPNRASEYSGHSVRA